METKYEVGGTLTDAVGVVREITDAPVNSYFVYMKTDSGHLLVDPRHYIYSAPVKPLSLAEAIDAAKRGETVELHCNEYTSDGDGWLRGARTHEPLCVRKASYLTGWQIAPVRLVPMTRDLQEALEQAVSRSTIIELCEYSERLSEIYYAYKAAKGAK